MKENKFTLYMSCAFSVTDQHTIFAFIEYLNLYYIYYSYLSTVFYEFYKYCLIT